MMRLLKYIRPWKGKANIAKDPDTVKFIVAMPLLPEQVPFEDPQVAWVPLLKMEDRDLANDTKFPHLEGIL